MNEYEKAYQALNRQPMQESDFDRYPESHRASKFAEHKIETCIEARNMAANEGKPWEFEWWNHKQKKHIPVFYASEDKAKHQAGVGFSFLFTFYECAATGLGSRLHCKTEEIAIEVGNNPEILGYYNIWIKG